jgi:hypothetical protein
MVHLAKGPAARIVLEIQEIIAEAVCPEFDNIGQNINIHPAIAGRLTENAHTTPSCLLFA